MFVSDCYDDTVIATLLGISLISPSIGRLSITSPLIIVIKEADDIIAVF